MAKQRRDRSTPAKAQTRKGAPRPQAGRVPEVVDEAAARRREAFLAAVAVYEQGVQALQARNFERAAELLTSVLVEHPDELDLHERVRLYLKICEREAAPGQAAPRTVDERLYAATLALNRGLTQEALAHLESVLQATPDNDHAHYMMAIVRVHRDELDEAAACLRQAIALNPENRTLARQDPDLEGLRQNAEIRAFLETSVPSDRRRQPRSRPTH
jgi:tetratricopeptide (TPR) repeat protein